MVISQEPCEDFWKIQSIDVDELLKLGYDLDKSQKAWQKLNPKGDCAKVLYWANTQMGFPDSLLEQQQLWQWETHG